MKYPGILLILIIITTPIFAKPENNAEDDPPPVEVLYWGPAFWNTAIWGPQAIVGVEFAQISPEVWVENLTNPWVWDNDEFSVNQIGHPYQGSLSYGTARGSGWGVTDSLFSTTISSISWELFMENETPSLNDLFVTTVGGLAAGEMLFRLSGLIDATQPEGEIFLPAEALSWILSPGGNMGALIYGTDPQQVQSTIIKTSVSAGGINGNVSVYEDDGVKENNQIMIDLMFGLDIKYGIPFEETPKHPYDLFFMRSSAGLAGTQFTASLFSEGLLMGHQIYFNNDNNDLIGIFMHYDFIYNRFLNLSANSIGFGWVHDEPFTEFYQDAALHGAFVLIGGTDCLQLKAIDYNNGLPEEERRNYDLSYGFNVKLLYEMGVTDFGSFQISESLYILEIIQDSVPAGGSAGHVCANQMSFELVKSITPTMAVKMGRSTYRKYSNYDQLALTSEVIKNIYIGVVLTKI